MKQQEPIDGAKFTTFHSTSGGGPQGGGGKNPRQCMTITLSIRFIEQMIFKVLDRIKFSSTLLEKTWKTAQDGQKLLNFDSKIVE